MNILKRTITAILLILFTTSVIKAEGITMKVGESKKIKLPSSVTILNNLHNISWSVVNNNINGVLTYVPSYNSVEVEIFRYYDKTLDLVCKYEYTGAAGNTSYGQYKYEIRISEPYFTFSINPSGGNVDKGEKVTFKCDITNVNNFSSNDVEYYYTLDGSTPSKSSTRYNEFYGITIDKTCTLQAIATWKGAESSIERADYVVNGLSVTASPSGGVVEKGTIVYLTASEYGADIYYTLDGYSPSRWSTPYTSSGITINEDCTLKAIAYKNDLESEVIIENYYLPVDPISISVYLTSSTIKAGESTQANYTLTPSKARTTVSWSSDDPNIASVELSTGKVYGVSEGTTYIRATTANGLTGQCSITVSGESNIFVNMTNFPDANFRNALIEQGIRSEDDVKKTNTLNLYNKAIGNLKGLNFFTLLENLDCRSNNLTTLDISKNSSLIYLYCEENQLSALDVSNNTSLRLLRCDNNNLTTLDVSKNTKISDFRCKSNQLTTLDVSKNTALYYFDCESNMLTSLDVSNNVALYYMSCRENQITAIDLSNNTKLEILDCSVNNLTYLNLLRNDVLKNLYCYNNQLTTLDLSNNIALKQLSCSNNLLTSLIVSQNGAIKELNFYGNYIKGDKMDALISSLPQISTNDGKFLVIFNSDVDGNVCTTTQVAAAKAKGWTPYDLWGHEYEGSDPTSIRNIQIDENDYNVPIYNLNGQRMDKPHKGINIISRKKVIIK